MSFFKILFLAVCALFYMLIFYLGDKIFRQYFFYTNAFIAISLLLSYIYYSWKHFQLKLFFWDRMDGLDKELINYMGFRNITAEQQAKNCEWSLFINWSKEAKLQQKRNELLLKYNEIYGKKFIRTEKILYILFHCLMIENPILFICYLGAFN